MLKKQNTVNQENKMINIAVDVMGGDHYPESPVRGALMALHRWPDISITLLGDRAVIEAEMSRPTVSLRYREHYGRVTIVEAPQLVPMEMEHPADVIRMEQSSIFIGIGMLQQGETAAFVSAGNTGAVMSAATVRLGRIRGIKRPALAMTFPTKNGPCLVLDVGANSSNIPLHLVQFALMGTMYAHKVIGVANPKVGLMSVGEEASKGNELVKITNRNLNILHKAGHINFFGNVQGDDIFAGTADVIVVEGFTGNALLKMAESMMPTLKEALTKKLQDNKFFKRQLIRLSAGLLKSFLVSVKHEFDYEQYGGAPLLGVKGVTIVAHGKSSDTAMMHAVRVARQAVTGAMIDKISAAISQVPMGILNLEPDSQ